MKNNEEYIHNKLQKAQKSFKESRLLIDNDMHETAISRLYYASFYAVSASLASHGYHSKTLAGANFI